MTVQDMIDEIGMDCVSCTSGLGRAVKGGYTGDLLSDVIANSTAGDAWITRQVHQNIVAVASLNDLACIIIVQGAVPDADTLEKAETEGIPVLTTGRSCFETAGRLFGVMNAKT